LRSDKTILVVDDDLHIRRVTELKFKLAGYQVITASNGQEGSERIQQDRPDAVVTDITMPIMDGKEMCEQTNFLKAEKPFLTVIITARIEADERLWINDMQDTVFMEKPFSPRRLQEIVDNYLGVIDGS
jgi:DNA-binding response OmpR family regulator